MPIVNLPPNPPEILVTPKSGVALTSPSYKHSIVDSKVTPHASLITYIEGSNFYGDWYSQIVSSDEELSEYQPNQLLPYQQYHLIKGLQTKLQDSLSFSNDPETNVLSITGTLRLHPHLKPNRGDVFIADVGDGRAGQFTVTEATQLSMFKETCYEVQITLARWVTQELNDNINLRVVKTSFFYGDYLLYGQNPIVAEESIIAQRTLTELEKDLFALFNKQFFSLNFRTYMVPGQLGPTYDSYVTRTLLKIYDVNDHPNLLKLKVINVDGLPYVFEYNVFDAIIFRERAKLAEAFKEFWLLNTGCFSNHVNFKSIYFSGIHYTVAAKDNVSNVDDEYTLHNYMVGINLRDLGDFSIDLASALYVNSIDDFLYPGEEALPNGSVYLSDEVPLIHAISSNTSYVFSQSFYNNDYTGFSKLEHLVSTYIDTGDINRTVLYAFCRSVREWGRLEKFFYIPVLLILLKASKRLV